MKALLRPLALWAALAALWWLLARTGSADLPGWLSLAGWFLLLPLAVSLTGTCAVVVPANLGLRLLFWTTTVGGWVAVLLAGQAGFEGAATALRQTLWVACAVAAAVAA